MPAYPEETADGLPFTHDLRVRITANLQRFKPQDHHNGDTRRAAVALTLVEVAYAAAETRPVQPPYIYLLLNGGRAGLRAQPVYLVPPEGLTLERRLAVLGLTVRTTGGRYTVTAADPRFGRQVVATEISHLVAILQDIKKRFPAKETLILQPEQTATVKELVEIISAVREEFPRIVLSGGQRVVVQ